MVLKVHWNLTISILFKMILIDEIHQILEAMTKPAWLSLREVCISYHNFTRQTTMQITSLHNLISVREGKTDIYSSCNINSEITIIGKHKKGRTEGTYKKKKKAVGGFFGFLASNFPLFFFWLVFAFLTDLGLCSSSSTMLGLADLFVPSVGLTLNTIFLNLFK